MKLYHATTQKKAKQYRQSGVIVVVEKWNRRAQS